MKILLDTGAYAGFKRNATEVIEIIVEQELIFPPVVLGELMSRFRSGNKI